MAIVELSASFVNKNISFDTEIRNQFLLQKSKQIYQDPFASKGVIIDALTEFNPQVVNQSNSFFNYDTETSQLSLLIKNRQIYQDPFADKGVITEVLTEFNPQIVPHSNSTFDYSTDVPEFGLPSFIKFNKLFTTTSIVTGVVSYQFWS